MKKKSFLVVAILVVGVASAISFAMTQTSATVSLTISGGGSSSFIDVTTEGTQKWTDAVASWTPIEDTAGGISTPGDLYYLEPYTTTGTVDALAFVYLTNAGELAECYSYLNMGLNLWQSTGGGYTEKTSGDEPDEWLTLSNGYVSFELSTATVVTYVITLDEVSWYCTDANADDGESLSPSFYVDVIQK